MVARGGAEKGRGVAATRRPVFDSFRNSPQVLVVAPPWRRGRRSWMRAIQRPYSPHPLIAARTLAAAARRRRPAINAAAGRVAPRTISENLRPLLSHRQPHRGAGASASDLIRPGVAEPAPHRERVPLRAHPDATLCALGAKVRCQRTGGADIIENVAPPRRRHAVTRRRGCCDAAQARGYIALLKLARTSPSRRASGSRASNRGGAELRAMPPIMRWR